MIIKPADQVPRLTDKDLAEEHTRVLKADNPQAPDNLARFNHKEKTYKFDPTVDQTAIALSLEGWVAARETHARAVVVRHSACNLSAHAARTSSRRVHGHLG
jgi:dynein intermediate chain 1